MAKQEFDLHGHTKIEDQRFPYFWPLERQTYSATDAVLYAKHELGIDGIAITDHDSIENLDEALNAGEKHGLIVVPGVEITSKANCFRYPHIIALGLAPEIYKKGNRQLPRGEHVETVVKWIHDNGAIAIAPHPQDITPTVMSLTSLTINEVKLYGRLFDGVEVFSPIIYPHNTKLLLRYCAIENIAQLGTSDFHALEGWMGLAKTEILEECHTWQDVVSAIKGGNTKPIKTY